MVLKDEELQVSGEKMVLLQRYVLNNIVSSLYVILSLLYIHCVYVICVINSTESTTVKCSIVSDTLAVHCTAMQRYLPALF